ncbi:MAG: fimbrial protein [Tannerellaceae bacterium]|nr:fimbrial protein [Tannerellaceae bacterium]
MICKVNIFNRNLNLFIGIVFFVYNFTACDTEKINPESGETEYVDILIAPITPTGNLVDDPNSVTDPDEIVAELRILVFNSSDELLVLNQYYDFTLQFENPVTFRIKAGTYDFIFIANEKSDAFLSTQLNNMVEETTTLTDFNGYSFSSAAFDANKNIPMSSACYDIMIEPTLGLSQDGGITYNMPDQLTPWEVEIERLGVRADITLQTKFATVAQDFQALQFDNIPDKVYILSQNKSGTIHYNNGSYEATPRIINLSEGDTGYTSGMVFNNTTNNYEWKKTRVILPESIFLNETNTSQGVQMTAKYNTASDQTATLGPLDNCSDLINHGYNLPRNHHLTVNGTFNINTDLTLDVKSWKIGIDEDINIGPVYKLSLSQSRYEIVYNTTPTLTITTDYPGGWTAEVSSDALSVIPSTLLGLSPGLGTAGTTNVVLTRDPSYRTSGTLYIHITAGNMTAIVYVFLQAAGGST